MNLSRKTTLFFAGLLLGLIVVLVVIGLYSFRAFSITSATEHVRSAAEIVRVHLTESMINGVIDRREGFLRRLTEVQGLKSARIVRGSGVERQFGRGLSQELEPDLIERQVMASGRPHYALVEDNGFSTFRGTIPFVATAAGSPNCLQCHQAREGEVLGAVTMTLSVDHLRKEAVDTMAGILAAVMLFGLSTLWLLRRLMLPVARTAREVETAVERAVEGNFKSRVEARTSDEIGHIASEMNRLLGALDDGLNRIVRRVSELTLRTPREGENLLTTTADMVDNLAKASHFKQAIEEDETKSEIYQRLVRTMETEFGLREFSVYEVHQTKHHLIPVYVDGQLFAECRWCDPEVLVRNEACRARRTGHLVDSVSAPAICTAFRPPVGLEDRQHICFPVLQSGNVGSVVQLVAPAGDGPRFQRMVPNLSVFLREAAPVLEAKRLMETLKDSTLRDPMTGLNNRRFLEEYVETLMAGAKRHKGHLVILMIDLDFFKMVNDAHGHDAGDAVLKELAKVLRQSVRSSDLVLRYGGEEFMVILQDTDAEKGVLVAENMRLAVEKLKIQIGGLVLQKTVSIGVSDFPGDGETFWQVVKFADIALYRAKEEGRNRVVRFRADMWQETAAY